LVLLALLWYGKSLAVAVTFALWLRLFVRLFLLFLLDLPSALKQLVRGLGRRGVTADPAQGMLSRIRARHASLAQRVWLIVDVALVSATVWLAGVEAVGLILGWAALCAVVPTVVLLLAQPFIGRIC
jgi:hypothetical protein